jgi:hypothetical protein
MSKDLFNFDVRVRGRMRGKGLISEQEVAKYLEALPDAEPHSVSLELRQPALGAREVSESGRVPHHSSVPMPRVQAPAVNFDDGADDEDDDAVEAGEEGVVARSNSSGPPSIPPETTETDEKWGEDE